MEFKVVISDPESGKSYQRDIKDEKARRFRGKRIGEEVDGSIFGLTGYTLVITGGSDKGGFPMKKGVTGKTSARVLMKEGVGYRQQKGIRKRKRVRGEMIDEDIIQINTKVISKGNKKIEELLGLETSEEGEGEKKEEKVEEKKEKKPEKEEKTLEEKPKKGK